MRDLLALDPTMLQRFVAAGSCANQMNACAHIARTNLQGRDGVGR